MHYQSPIIFKISLFSGNQPPGEMKVTQENFTLPGFPPSSKTLMIEYSIKSGLQNATHPNPGMPFKCQGFPRYAFLPDDDDGRKIAE